MDAAGPPRRPPRNKMAVAAPISGRRDGRDACTSARFHSSQGTKNPVAARSTSRRERERARGLVALAYVDLDVGPCIRARRDPSSLSHHCNSQRLTHHRLALPRPEKGTVISGHSGTIGPRLFHPVPEREKEGKKARRGPHVRTRGRGETLGALPAARRPRRRHHRLRPIRR